VVPHFPPGGLHVSTRHFLEGAAGTVDLKSLVSRINRWFSDTALWLSAGGLVLMTAIIGWQVFGRYVLNDTPNWSERLSLFLMTWYILLAAAVGVRERFHIGLVFFKEALPGPAALLVDMLVHLLVAAFGAAMIWYGAEMAASTWSHVIPTLGLPVGLGYLPFPLSGTLIVLFSLEHLLVDLRGGNPAATARDAS